MENAGVDIAGNVYHQIDVVSDSSLDNERLKEVVRAQLAVGSGIIV